MADWLTQAKAILKEDEGLCLKAYPDSKGFLTVGYGHNLKNPISEGVANHILDDDVLDALKDLCTLYPNFINLTDNRKIVLISMIFNMGMPVLAEFKKMFAALTAGDYAKAAEEMMLSQWSMDVKDRAKRLAALMIKG